MPIANIVYPWVKIAGADLAAGWADSLVDVSIEQTIGTSGHASLRFFLAPLSELAATEFTPGDAIEIGADLDGESATLFKGFLLSHGVEVSRSGQIELSVEAFDAAHKLGRATTTAAYTDTNLSDVVTDVASGLGIATDIQSVDTAQYPVIQVSGTARQVLDKLARDVGAQWWLTLEDGTETLHFGVPDLTAAAAHTYEYGVDLIALRMRSTTVDSNASVTVVGWDPASKAKVESTSARDSNVVGEWRAPSSRAVRSQTEAGLVAGGVKGRLDSIAKTGRAEIDLDPTVKLGELVAFGGVPGWEDTYLVRGVNHQITGDGTRSTVIDLGALDPSSMIDLLGGASPGGRTAAMLTTGVTVGVVSDNVDPDALNRVKVTLPYFDDIVSTWARLVQPGAGGHRGWHTLPEVGDEVLVAFEHGDLRHPYVLGGLWNSVDTPPVVNDDALMNNDGVSRRSYTSRLGHELVFHDGDQPTTSGLLMTVSGGENNDPLAKLDMNEERTEVSRTGAEEIKIASQDASIVFDTDGGITIKAKTVKIEATDTNLELTAQGDLTSTSTGKSSLSASQDLELTTSMNAKLEASLETTISGLQVKVN